jgi:hypothetical protein
VPQPVLESRCRERACREFVQHDLVR